MDSIFQSLEKDPESFLEYHQGNAQAYKYLGDYERREVGDYDKSIEYYEKSLKIIEKGGSPEEMTRLFLTLGISWELKGDYDKALNYYLQSLKICEEQDLTTDMTYPLTNIAILYMILKNFEKAEEYYQINYDVVKKYGSKENIGNALNNLGNVYLRKENFDKAMDHYLQALEIFEEVKDKEGIARVSNNLGAIYYYQEDYERCLKYFKKALEMRKEAGDKIRIAQSLNNIGETYKAQGNIQKALEYLERSLKLAQETRSMSDIVDISEVLSVIYKSKGEFKKALEYHTLSTQTKDSLFTIESSRQIADMQTKYETEKKEHQIELQKSELNKKDAEARNRTIQLWAAIAAIFLAVFISVREWRSRKRTKKANVLLAKQRADLAEKNKDITDSIRYAQRIQDAILPSTEYCNKVLPQHFILFKPHSIVSGDFYWMYDTTPRPSPRSAAEALERNRQGEGDPPSGPEKTSAHKVIWITADCTGHGVPGAFMSMIGNSLLNEIVVEKGITTPGVILDELKSGIINALGQTGAAGQSRDGMDAALCVWDKKSNVLEFAGAYNPLYLVRKGIAHSKLGQNGTIQYYGDDLAEIKADRQPIAYEEGKEAPFTTHQIQLQKGDVIYTFSDGIQDQFGGPKTKKFTAKRLKETLVSMQSTPMPKQEETLNEIIEDWKGGEEQIDDIVLIGVKVE